ncbi:Beta-1,3-galactosyltransferase 1 [Holothuria leucospilota]|uniref:Hexosyltransferase n=1 Tax=Holothuria leucospilota TaxID=206669 RepID=A0A9Q0YIA9_HOLLE|nr:Beta-1,3-galactosyltransferase 1 [Holothuria leucospilota]
MVNHELSVVPGKEMSNALYDTGRKNTYSNLKSSSYVSRDVNLRGASFTIRNLCKVTQKNAKKVFLMVVMISAPMNFEQRKLQRLYCLNVSEISGKRIERLFLVGNSGNSSLNKRIKEESIIYQDIVMGNFHDSYRNLSLKTLFGLRWASMYCSQAHYVMKADDDTFINFKPLIDTLSRSPKENFITGHLCTGCKPVRNITNKWYTSEEKYPGEFYPEYLFGAAYVMSGDLPRKILLMSRSTPPFLWEDVYIGMILEKLGLKPLQNPCFIADTHDLSLLTPCSYISACAIHFANRGEDIFQFCRDPIILNGNAKDIC